MIESSEVYTILNFIKKKCIPTHYRSPFIVNKSIIVHKSIDWLCAIPDEITSDGCIVVIADAQGIDKNSTVSAILYSEWIKVQIQLEVCDLSECRYVINRLDKCKTIIVKRDRYWFSRVYGKLVDFWQNLVNIKKEHHLSE